MRDENGMHWLLCYNHDTEHTYFDMRRGFTRGSMKYQGLVGIPSKETTRLTWLQCVDFRGLVPFAAAEVGLMAFMFYPQSLVLSLEELSAGDDGSGGGSGGGGGGRDADRFRRRLQRLSIAKEDVANRAYAVEEEKDEDEATKEMRKRWRQAAVLSDERLAQLEKKDAELDWLRKELEASKAEVERLGEGFGDGGGTPSSSSLRRRTQVAGNKEDGVGKE